MYMYIHIYIYICVYNVYNHSKSLCKVTELTNLHKPDREACAWASRQILQNTWWHGVNSDSVTPLLK